MNTVNYVYGIVTMDVVDIVTLTDKKRTLRTTRALENKNINNHKPYCKSVIQDEFFRGLKH